MSPAASPSDFQHTVEQDSTLPVRRRAILLSVFIGLVLLGVKFTAALLTDSAAILSDALESIINVVASGFALYSIVLSAAPPDRSHPYGHGKVESFSAGFEGALIMLAALAIVWKAVPGLTDPRPLVQLDYGLGLIIGAAGINAGLGFFLIRTGQRTRSLALTADGKHVLTDVYTSLGVVLGLVLVRLTGWLVLDAVTACLVAVNILVSGVDLLRVSVSHLMDSADASVLDRITTVLQRQRQPEWINVHQVRAWHSGERPHIDFHLTLPWYWNLEQGHQTQAEVEALLLDQLGRDGDVLVHIDPCIPQDCPNCQITDCPVRAAPFRSAPVWTPAQVTYTPLAV